MVCVYKLKTFIYAIRIIDITLLCSVHDAGFQKYVIYLRDEMLLSN